MIRIVLPAYNEAGNIGLLLDGIQATFADRPEDFTVLVVDDGSTDATADEVNARTGSMPVTLLKNEVNSGLSKTLKRGLVEAVRQSEDGDVIVTMDGDNTHLPGLIPRMVQSIREGNDVVVASRYREGSTVRGVTPFRLSLSWGAGRLFRFCYPIHGVRDYTCGYRAYRAAILKQAFQHYGEGFIDQPGFSCMVDILLKLDKLGAIATELPFVLRYDFKMGVSKMRVAKTVRETVVLLVRRRLNLN